MSVAATRRELDKVTFETKRVSRRDEPDSASDTESDVTELAEGEDEPEYYPDAIKWARYRDSHGDRPDGWKGWHYGVMWTGYLKTFSDTEEPFEVFETDEAGRNQMLEDFWSGVGRPLVWKKDKSGMKEPKGKLREVVFPPEDLMKRWLADARPRRSYKLFKIRENKERSLPPGKIQKRDSDYYWYRDLKAKAKAKAEREAARVAAGEAGPSKLAKIPRHIPSTVNTPVDSEDDDEEKRKAAERKAKAGSTSLDALFEDDAKAKAEDEKRRKEIDALFSDDDEKEVTRAVEAAGVDKKRKPGKSTPDVGTSKGQDRGPSPPKKQRSPTLAPAPTKAQHAALSATATVSQPSTSVSTSTNPKAKEPLFLSSDASPTDTYSKPLSPIDSFGEPLPGIFFMPSFMGGDNQASKPAEVKPVIASEVANQPTTAVSASRSRPTTPIAATSGTSTTASAAKKAPTPPATSTTDDAHLASPPVSIKITAPTPKAFVKAPQVNPSATSSPVVSSLSTGSPVHKNASGSPIESIVSAHAPPQPAASVKTDPQKITTPPALVASGSGLGQSQPEADVEMPSSTTQSPLQTSPGPVLPPSPNTVGSVTANPVSISPPRYSQAQTQSSKSPKSPTLLMSPPNSASKSLSPSTPSSPNKPAIPVSDRPKYVQPKLVKVMDAIVDPEAEARRQKLAARKGSNPTPAHPTLPVRPLTIVPPTGSIPKPPTSAPPPPPPIHPSHTAPPGPSSAPIQPKSWGAQPPVGPSAMHARPPAGYGQLGIGPLADQKEAYKANKAQAPWVQRQQSGGRQNGAISPSLPYHNASPVWNGGGASPIVHMDRFTPNAPATPHTSNLSPQWMASHNAQPPPPGFPGFRPPYQPNPPQAVDPRSASASPMIHNASPMGPLGGQTPIPQAADPRRPSYPPQTPLQNVPRSPDAGGSSASGSRRIDTLGRVALRLDYQDHVHRLQVSRGAFPGQMVDGDAMLAQLLGDGTGEISLHMDDVDLSLVNWQIKQFGARMVQWAKLGCPDTDKGRRAQWDKLKTQSHQQGKAWVTYTELPYPDQSVTAHYALIVTDSSNFQSELVGPGLGLGPWASNKEVGMALIVLALPLDSVEPPMLPDPVRPDLLGPAVDIKPKHDMMLDQMHLLASYDLSPQYFKSLSGRPAVTYPPKDGDYDLLKISVEREYQYHGVKPHDGSLPDHVLFDNAKMGRAVKSSTIRQTVNRRTQYFAAGPSLHLAPSQWKLTEIWRTGGLVTFSPTFILRNPKKFAEIMRIIRTAPNWEAYVIPELVQWVETSWKKPTRCPRPTEAYQAFSKSLVVDDHLLKLSGSKACSGGGLAVTTCPPLNSEIDDCATWLDWLSRTVDQKEYKALVKLCFDYSAKRRDLPVPQKGEMDMDLDEPELDLDLVDIETKQIEDLTNLRMRPHIVPYRRYIYIGEVSLGAEKRNKLATGIECVDPDSFAALLSGAI